MTPELDNKEALALLGHEKCHFHENDLICYCYRGSVAHGTYIPSGEEQSTDDIDVAGVYFAPREHYIGIMNDSPLYKAGLELKEGKYDGVFYELRKYIKMCITSNPTALAYLWTKQEHQIIDTDVFGLLVGERNLFLTKRVYKSFVEYAKQQFKLMTKIEKFGYMGAKRSKLSKNLGYDYINAAHVLRLLIMCRETLTTRRLEVYREADAEMFKNVKRGYWSLYDIEKTTKRLFLEAESAYNKCTLPDDVDYKKVNDLVMTLVKPII
jgi:predicted nucleotidyltransferase